MATVTLYGTDTCVWCGAARLLLKKKGVAYDDVLVNKDPARREEMEARSGRQSVPQIFAGDRLIGGYDELAALDAAGELDDILAAS